MDLTNHSTIISLLQKYNLFAKKSFSQNFLINRDILNKIIETGNISKNDLIIEVGPGLGVLTQELSEKAEKVITIELDRSLLPLLKETLSSCKNVELINADALKFIPPNEQYKVIANIPYSITSHLINHFVQAENKPDSITLLVQKEVAKKITQLEPDMSVLSLQIALFGKAKYIKDVPSGNFHPVPKVDSAIIHIELYKSSDTEFTSQDQALKILRIAKICFSQRRKKLRNTLPQEYQKNTNLDLSRRPETLSVQEWKSFMTL